MTRLSDLHHVLLKMCIRLLELYLLSQKSQGKGLSSQWRNLMWIFRAASVVHVMSQKGHFT